ARAEGVNRLQLTSMNCKSILVPALVLSGILFSFSTFAQTEVKDVFAPAAPETVRIGGRLGEKLDLCVTNRLLAQDIEAVVAPYFAKTETGGADWRCE